MIQLSLAKNRQSKSYSCFHSKSTSAWVKVSIQTPPDFPISFTNTFLKPFGPRSHYQEKTTDLFIQDSRGSAETDDYVISQMKTRPGNKQLSSQEKPSSYTASCLAVFSRQFYTFSEHQPRNIEDKVYMYHSYSLFVEGLNDKNMFCFWNTSN